MSMAPKKPRRQSPAGPELVISPSPADFDEVVRMIDLYWNIGEYISRKIESAAWGEGVVDQLAAHIARTHLGMRGYTRANLFRMRQFYETYRGVEKVEGVRCEWRQDNRCY